MSAKIETVIERKLGREKADGLAWHYKGDKLIEIDPRLSPQDYMETLIHEKLHLMFPKMTEKQVLANSRKLQKFLWKYEFRRVHQ